MLLRLRRERLNLRLIETPRVGPTLYRSVVSQEPDITLAEVFDIMAASARADDAIRESLPLIIGGLLLVWP